MQFGPLPVAEALGATLAHGVKAGTVSLRKGRLLSAADLAALREAGVDTVTVVRLDPDDLGEDEAAARVAAAVLGPGLQANAPFTGRVNLFASAPGLLVPAADAVDRINLLHEAVTLATLPAFAPLATGDMAATIKIIPFAAPRQAVEAVEAAAREAAPVLRLAPFRPLSAVLIQTTLPGVKDSVLDKTAAVTRERLASLGGTLLEERRVAHEEAALASAIAAGPIGELLLIAGASAITDRRDVLPAAIERAGGTVAHFGMPVDPGNLLLLASIGKVPVLGMPGCARSPKLNGFDWVVQRIAAGLPPSRRDIMRMGVGGLLAEIPSRPLPRLAAGAAEQTAAGRPRVAALVLAAGRSSRMGGPNKLLEDLAGLPLVRHTVDAALASQAAPVVVVTGHQSDRVAAALDGLPVTIIHNPAYAEGLSTSLKAGLAALPPDASGALVCLGDMPRVSSGLLDRLIAAHNPLEGRAIVVPVFDGRRGNPVLWDRSLFAEMAGVTGDTGARHLIGSHAELVCEVTATDDGTLTDVDTPEALALLRAGEDARDPAP